MKYYKEDARCEAREGHHNSPTKVMWEKWRLKGIKQEEEENSWRAVLQEYDEMKGLEKRLCASK